MNLQHNENSGNNTKDSGVGVQEGATKEPDSTINIDSAQIPVVPLNQQFSGSTLLNLSKLGVQTYNPDEVEKSILNQIDVAMAKEDEAAKTRLLSIRKEISEINKIVKNTKIPDLPPNATQDDKEVVEGMQLARALKLRRLDELQKQETRLSREIKNRQAVAKKTGQDALNFGLEEETENDKLIRTGKITPLEAALEESRTIVKEAKKATPKKPEKPTSTTTTSTTTTTTTSTATPKVTKKRTAPSNDINNNNNNNTTTTTSSSRRSSVSQPPQRRAAKKRKVDTKTEEGSDEEERENSSDEDYEEKPNINKASSSEESDGVESDELVDDSEILGSVGEDEDVPEKRKIKMEGENWVDDGNESLFQKRITEFLRLRWLNKIEKKKANGEEVPTEEPDIKEMEDDEEINEDDVEFDGGMRVPLEMYENLFEYQKTGVRWLWELHCQNAGGIIGDEMGLGKTVQSICFLGALHHSKLLDGPCIVICPATLMTQWVREFHTWWPPFRVALLHGSGSHTGPRADVINTIAKKGHILITTYEGIRIYQEELLKHRWEYLVMDEGHKIRNPDAEITLTCKKFPTTHRVILTGAPIQNNLTELWSLFDFVFPGRLGTLPIFQAQFEVPIALGGYANATPVQVQTAYKCAVALRDLINPYMLRRMKADVLKSLPNKTEQVLFCQLTDDQKTQYRTFLKGQEVQQVLDGRRHLLYAIDWMRKICNHPDLLLRDSPDRPADYGNWERSGKLRVVEQILPMWQQQKHKVLLFCQTRQMLDIVEDFVKEKSYKYLRLDGVTAIKQRMALVDTFNNDPSYFVFILTTKVGGLGINLVGADRVLLFDPDWNPSTDVQARERVWRIGQKRDVTIYRLITSGTIEEKIYHRQIFKEFLTNKILKDPRQKRFFKSKNLHDLFTLGDNQNKSETSDIFANLNPDVKPDEDHDDESDKKRRKGKNKRTTDQKEEEEEEGEDEASNAKKRDDMKILRALFNGESLQGAVKHDAIVDQSNPEHIIVEYEANRIAEKAVEALRRSRQSIQRNRSDAGTPTWTGRSGQAGAPQRFGSSSSSSIPKPRFGSQSLLDTLSSPSPAKPPPSSSILSTSSVVPSSNVIRNFGSQSRDRKMKEIEKEREKVGEVGFVNVSDKNGPISSQNLLQKLKEGGGNSGKKATFSDGVSVSVAPGQDMEQTLSAILDFITEQGGTASTQAIVQKFQFSTLPEDAPVFRGMLRRIANFDNQARVWTVKPEWVLES